MKTTHRNGSTSSRSWNGLHLSLSNTFSNRGSAPTRCRLAVAKSKCSADTGMMSARLGSVSKAGKARRGVGGSAGEAGEEGADLSRFAGDAGSAGGAVRRRFEGDEPAAADCGFTNTNAELSVAAGARLARVVGAMLKEQTRSWL